MRKVVVASAASETASILREEILRNIKDDEWLIGSEDDVMRSLGVSRPTLRQALRILEQEQLITVRRGVGGGLFGRRPTEEGVTHTASVFLRSQGTTFGDLTQALQLLSVHCARVAAKHPDDERRRELGTYYDTALRGVNPEELDGREFVEIAGGFFRELATLADSTVVHLFVSALIELARPAAGAALYTPERIRQTIKRHGAIAEAIEKRQASLAVRRVNAHFAQTVLWTNAEVELNALYPAPDEAARARA